MCVHVCVNVPSLPQKPSLLPASLLLLLLLLPLVFIADNQERVLSGCSEREQLEEGQPGLSGRSRLGGVGARCAGSAAELWNGNCHSLLNNTVRCHTLVSHTGPKSALQPATEALKCLSLFESDVAF